MTTQVMEVQQVISRSRAILVRCMIVQLWRAIVCCDIAKRRQQNRVDSLHYVVVAEAASARFKKLHLQGKIFDSDILALMARLEEGLTGTADDLFPQHPPAPPGSMPRSPYSEAIYFIVTPRPYATT